MLQLEMERLKKEIEILMVFSSKIKECARDEYHQIIERGGW